MKRIKITRRIIYLFFAGLFLFIVLYAWRRIPIISGFAAKGMCSGVFVGHRSPASVAARELSFFPISLARTTVNPADSSVTATVFGLAKRKAVYRRGLGCALLADTPEETVKVQAFLLPSPSFSPDTVAWPLGSVLPDTLPPGVNVARLNSVLHAAIDPPDTTAVKKTLAVAVVYDNVLVGEAYAPGIDINTPLLGWSMTKSIISALTGLRVADHQLDIHVPAPVPEWQNDAHKNITLNSLLHMTSGMQWDENYFDLSDATKMLYVYGDMYRYAIGRPVAVPPDSVWYYSSGTTNIVSGIIRYTFSNYHDYVTYPYLRLFYRTGMLHTTLEADASGTFVGSSYSYATARDWARFGMLYLNRGIFNGDTILPPEWVDYTIREAPHSNGTYGAQWWLNKNKKLPDVPEDTYFCDGFQGQRVFVIPSKKLVVVRLGWSMKNFDFNEFLKEVISTLPENETSMIDLKHTGK